MKITADNYIQALCSGQEEALDYCLDQYGWIIKTVVRKQLFSLPNYQDDCLNDVLLAIWHNIGQFDETRSSFKNWVAGIARCKAMDYKRKYLKMLAQENWDEVEVVAPDESLKDILEQELSQELTQMLGCLKEADQQLFMKYYVDQEEMAQISHETGLKQAVIYNRLSRGKEKIRKLFPALGKERS